MQPWQHQSFYADTGGRAEVVLGKAADALFNVSAPSHQGFPPAALALRHMRQNASYLVKAVYLRCSVPLFAADFSGALLTIFSNRRHAAVLAVGVLVWVAPRAHGQQVVSARAMVKAELPDAPVPQQQPAPAPPRAGHASIAGVVSDIRGGLVNGAHITLTFKGHDVETETSAADGSFAFRALEPGQYNVVISAAGLETFLSPLIVLKAEEHYLLPDIALPVASATETVNVVMTQSQVADEELKLETKQRVLGVFPNFYTSFLWNAAPLNTKQKFKLSLRTTLDPIVFLTTGVVAGIEQERNTFPEYGDDADAYGKRYGAAFGDAFIGRTLGSAVFPSIFRQDPRYFFMGPEHSTKQRFKHAILAGLIARGDNGKWQPNYSHIAGNASAGAISTLYHPDNYSAGGLALRNGLIGIAGGGIQGLVREFVTSRITHKVPSYAKGKPAPANASASTPPAQPVASPVPPSAPLPPSH